MQITRGGGGGVLGFSFAGYVPLASQSPCPIIVYFVASYRPHLSHFWKNVIFAIPTKSLSNCASTLSILYIGHPKLNGFCLWTGVFLLLFHKQQLSELFNRDHFESILNRIFLPQISENVRPHSSNSIENATPF